MLSLSKHLYRFGGAFASSPDPPLRKRERAPVLLLSSGPPLHFGEGLGVRRTRERSETALRRIRASQRLDIGHQLVVLP